MTCTLWLSGGRESHQPQVKRDFLLICFLFQGNSWPPGSWHREAPLWQTSFPRVAPSLWFTSCTPTSMSRQLEGCAEAGGCLEIRTTPPVSSRRGHARFVLGVVKDMDFGGVLLPHFLGTLAQGQVTPWWGCVLTSYSHCLCLASPLHPVPCRNPRLGGHRAAPGCAFETRGSLGSSTAPQRPGRRGEGPVSL